MCNVDLIYNVIIERNPIKALLNFHFNHTNYIDNLHNLIIAVEVNADLNYFLIINWLILCCVPRGHYVTNDIIITLPVAYAVADFEHLNQ